MSENPPAAPVSDESLIRDAACLIVIDTSVSEPTLLMGRRHADQIFLPSKWVFPGGHVDADDRALANVFQGQYAPHDLAPAIRPFALAAVRELSEETGLVIGGEPSVDVVYPSWRGFTAAGYAPAPAHLFPLARAITPPGRVRRYDTWFFIAARSAIAPTELDADGELLDLGWFTFNEARKLDLPNITKLVLEDVAEMLRPGADATSAGEQLPFYYSDACGFRRALISCRATPCPP
jgi:8-oxo-dGTP pyrophosphatase MutT (NUDIX family)